ncbi:hypothetical protein BGZ80_010847 [Entomortierella chlamydospora]|uniref:Uncharacterized protein n=1 Tax=Entomortierella chlamydospora TaxID=101097 RepID=A0A9P6MU89_9FUNG|nr:hypothetical protein BGZ80_010847 [Entomortierella chlamydospora]
MAFTVHAAPMGQSRDRPQIRTLIFDDKVAPPGPLSSNWVYENYLKPEHKHLREQKRQERRLAFQLFSEKFVSADCTPILSSTLVHLDMVRGFVHDGFKTKTSFEFLEPILGPLVNILDMHQNRTFPTEYVEKKVDDTSSAQIKFGSKKDITDYYEIIKRETWTEENEPELIFKFHLRYLEKSLGVFQYALQIAPEPVRQELEANGFLQDTVVLRKHARSLLTCQGVPHVTVVGLEEEIGEERSDSYMDRYAGGEARIRFYFDYHHRVIIAQHRYAEVTMFPELAGACGLRNITRDASPEPSEEKPSKEVGVDTPPPSLQDTFVWSNEAMKQMADALKIGHRTNPELAAILFRD